MAVGGDAYFDKIRSDGGIVVSEPPKFDLEAYVSNYRGKTRVLRLYHIGKTSSYLYLDALKLATAAAKEGKDVKLYQRVVRLFQEVAPNEPEAVEDTLWSARTTAETKAETARMEVELKGYKNNLIKESIRMGYGDLGQHYHSIGDLSAAAKAFQKMREYCQTAEHLAAMQFFLIHIYIDQESWLSVESNVAKLRASRSSKPVETSDAKMYAALGLAQMAMKNYEPAATNFLQCDPRMLQAKLDDPNDEESYNEVLTPNDIATYGALCALASLSRKQLQARVLENTKFRNFLELEPHLRRAISSFVSCKYSACLEILEAYRADYLLDVHLSRHVRELFTRIRDKAMVQYFEPFSCISIAELAKAFNTDEDTVYNSFVELIHTRQLDARIDLENRTVVEHKVESRIALHEDALKAAKEYEKTLHQRLLRMEVIHSWLEIKPDKPQNKQFDPLLDPSTSPRKRSQRDNFFMQGMQG